ncbi:MAG: endolytic transglycosylase MltG [Rhodospirillales bacterium]
MGRGTRVVLALFAFSSILVVAAAGLWWSRTVSPGPLRHDTTLIIEKGAASPEIAAQLAAAHVIASPYLFELAVRFSDPVRPLKSGEYAFPAHISQRDVLDMLQDGRTVVHKLIIPEGLTTAQVITRLQAAYGLVGEIAEMPAEGTLLPATYTYSWGDGRQGLLNWMSRGMHRTVDTLWAERQPDLPLKSPEEAVILASIVEKETAIPSERPRIAAVFLNRLRLGMRLEADPTVAYGVGGDTAPLGRPLTRTDLRRAHPYNTYVIAGLPPGPIANPGKAALAAVLQPIKSDELYFVADGAGGHAFARTYEEHKDNVSRWRALVRDRTRDDQNAPVNETGGAAQGQ